MHRTIATTIGTLLAVVLTLLAVVLTLVPGTAHAGGEVTERPEADARFSYGDTVVFENRSHPGWQAPAVVADYDSRLSALKLLVGDCVDHPDAACVRIRGVNKPNAWWWGLWTDNGVYDARIELNRAHGRDRYVACHEIGHALGLKHHRMGDGCLKEGEFWQRHASTGEMIALRKAYGFREEEFATGAVAFGARPNDGG